MSGAAFILPGRLLRTGLMLVLGLLAIYVEAAPLGVGPSAPPSPDLLLCVVVFWAARQPRATPMLAVFALGLLRDIVTDAPTGAGALALVLAAEAVRGIRRRLARGSVMLEWLTLAAAAFATAAFMWLLTVLALSQPPYVAQLFHQSLYTIMAYPAIALALRWGLRISWQKTQAA